MPSRRSDRFSDELTVEALSGRRTWKWASYGSEVLPADIAEMDFPLAPGIREALTDAIGRSATGYPPARELLWLRSVCAEWLLRSFGFHASADRVHIVPDVTRGLEV